MYISIFLVALAEFAILFGTCKAVTPNKLLNGFV
jgi:hypothetical protein